MGEMTGKSDLYYVNRVKAGETECFTHLVRRHSSMLLTVINKVVGRQDIAEDIMQEVFVKAYQNLERFRGDAKFSTWLYRIAYNTAISEVRKRRNAYIEYDDNYHESVKNEAVAIDDSEVSSKERQLKLLDKLLKEMPEEDALLITMFYYNDYSIREISSITNLTESNVKVRLHRLRRQMNADINSEMKHERA